MIEKAYASLREVYKDDENIQGLFTVDEQCDMIDKINEEEGDASKVLTEATKHGNQQTNIVEKMFEGGLM